MGSLAPGDRGVSWQSDERPPDEDPRARFGRPGGDWQGVRRTLDNPLSWSLRLGRLARIEIRVHLIFVLFVVIELLRAAFPATPAGAAAPLGLGPSTLMLGCLFLLVLAHEFGHCLACRRAGGEADEILMWPLGGLAFCRPPQRWAAHLQTAVGGPLVNVLVCLVVTPILAWQTGRLWGTAVANPFAGLIPLQVTGSWLLMTLYMVNLLSLILLLFNLLPIFPLDGGRIVQALLWPKIGYARSMRVAVWTGYFGALALGIVGFVLANFMLVGIALFGGIICYITSRQLTFTEDFLGFDSDEFDVGGPTLAEAGEPGSTRRSRRAQRHARRDQEEAKRVDEVLTKVSRSGYENLSAAERRLLRRATKRRQQNQETQ